MTNMQIESKNKNTFYDLCKTDSILSQWSDKELSALKLHSKIMQQLLSLNIQATCSISKLNNNDSKPLSQNQYEVIQKNMQMQTKEAFSLYFYTQDSKQASFAIQEIETIKALTFELKPWRKGPFYFRFLSDSSANNTQAREFYIDSEWQSNKKMGLILQALNKIKYSLQDKVVLDVGCNNGYYMFDLALRGVKHIIGIDPIAIFFLQFYFIYKLARIPNCSFRLLGIQDISKLCAKYDLILCLGVLYHRKEPLQTLRQLKSVLQPNGIVLLETLIIQSDMPTCLCPYPTYAKMSNVFYIFSPQSLQNLALHAGFKTCELISYSYTDNSEQRTTDFIQNQSLGDFLSHTQTTEGYPPACRGIFVLS